MKEQDKIPSSKVKRASRFVRTGLKVGGNYVKHYAKKAVNPDLDREDLDRQNADDIYGTLSQLKGGALKIAQMLSMDQGILPAAFADKFSEAQYRAPALSGPLVVKTFRQYLGQSPQTLFDSFEMKASHAASIGQVHRATKDGKTLAVKVQYPGVGDSLISDLKLVKPFAKTLLNLTYKDLDVYFNEVKDRLLEETDYELELTRSQLLAEKCSLLAHVQFPHYYPEYSSKRVITMDWLEGKHLDDFLATNPSQELRNQMGQALLDFYNFQLHKLQLMHADAHPGNFLFREDGTLGVIDFGCVKEVPMDFYTAYRLFFDEVALTDEALFLKGAIDTGTVYADEPEEDRQFFLKLLHDSVSIMLKPFYQGKFDFGDKDYFEAFFAHGEQIAKMPELRKSNALRGSQHGIYINRALIGLFMILHKLEAHIETRRFIDS